MQSNTAAVATAPAPKAKSSPATKASSPAPRLLVLIGILVTLIVGLVVVSQQPRPQIVAPSSRPVVSQPQPRLVGLVDTAFTLKAAQGMQWNFTVPQNASNVNVEGTFTASGGTGNDVEVYLLNDDEFVNWQNGHAVSPIYSSGRMTQGTLDAVLPSAGTYHLVFSNRFSLLSPKAVRASIRLHYTL